MTTMHTPGPWYIGSGTYEGRNIYSAEAVTDDEGFTYNPVVATAEDDGVVCWDANARLIAAAPDLLEALQVMLRDYSAAHASCGDLEMSPALLQAQQAIFRAIGDQL